MSAPTSTRTHGAGTNGALNPDRLAELEEQRDHLLASLRDLESEHDVGDLDDVDYGELKDDYTARAAEVIRAIEAHRDLVERSRPERNVGRTLLIVVTVLAVAVVAGVLVARSSGQRGSGTITGNDNSLRQQLASCQMLSFQKPAKGVECYSAILKQEPDNLEALTYQGWALVRDDKVTEGAKNLARAVKIDPDYPDARVFRAILLSRAGTAAQSKGDAIIAKESFTAAAAELDRFYRNDPPQVAVQVLQQQNLERTIFFGLLDAQTFGCWQQAAAGSEADKGIDQAFLDTMGTCLDAAIAQNPSSTDALLSKALTQLGPERTDLAGSKAYTERVLALDPQNANALLLQASIAVASSDFDGALALLDRIDTMARPTAAFLIGPPDVLRKAIAEARKAASPGVTTTVPATRSGAPASGAGSGAAGSSTPASGAAGSATTTTAPRSVVSTVPGAPQIPNAGGG